MNTTIEHKHPIGTKLIRPGSPGGRYTVTGVKQSQNGAFYTFSEDNLAYAVVAVDACWTATTEPNCYYNVYPGWMGDKWTTRAAADRSAEVTGDDRIALIAVFDDGVEVIEGARGGGTGVAS